MTFKFEDCIKGNLLRKVPASEQKAERSIKKAKMWLSEARISIDNRGFNSAVMGAYLTMFHSARAILFSDGWREKSHACISRYLDEKYVKSGKLDKKWVQILDYQRNLRHEDQYNIVFYSTEEEADKAIQSAELFLLEMEKLLQI